jgi:hypothetical protein
MCGSCKQFKPTFVELGTQRKASPNRQTARRYSMRELPLAGLLCTALLCWCARLITIHPAGKFTEVKAGAVNIDDEKGMALANQLGVLNGGIPYIGLFGAKAKAHSPGSGRVSVMVGAPKPLHELETTVKDLLAKMGA